MTSPLLVSAKQPSASRMWRAAWMVSAVFMLSNSTTPLYVYWQAQMGFSSGVLTVIFALYIAGLFGTLLVAGQLSDRYGRKPVLVPGLIAALVACGLFASATSVYMLALGRLLAGVAVGVIVSAGMAAVVDAAGGAAKTSCRAAGFHRHGVGRRAGAVACRGARAEIGEACGSHFPRRVVGAGQRIDGGLAGSGPSPQRVGIRIKSG
ncbi:MULTISPECIES: MFS transporter [Pandoraea]|uniref:MFS transporter n=1 Tax=Pandoraea TaxID=93217 RepID=UPI001F5E1A68|nr:MULTISPECIES: MFS transporter [Pandoraea]